MLAHGAAQYLQPKRTIRQTFDGQEWTFTVMLLEQWSEKARYILSKAKSPFDLMRELPPDVPGDMREATRKQLVEMATGIGVVTPEEEHLFDRTTTGFAYDVWRALRDNHEALGKMPDGTAPAAIVYESGGVGYTVTPDEGVDLANSWITRHCIEPDDYKRLARLRHALSEADLLGESSSPTLKNQSEADGADGEKDEANLPLSEEQATSVAT